jgi:hypothetical protein
VRRLRAADHAGKRAHRLHPRPHAGNPQARTMSADLDQSPPTSSEWHSLTILKHRSDGE